MAVAALTGIVGTCYMYKAAPLHVALASALATWRQPAIAPLRATQQITSHRASVVVPSTAVQLQIIFIGLLAQLKNWNFDQHWFFVLFYVASYLHGRAQALRIFRSHRSLHKGKQPQLQELINSAVISGCLRAALYGIWGLLANCVRKVGLCNPSGALEMQTAASPIMI